MSNWQDSDYARRFYTGAAGGNGQDVFAVSSRADARYYTGMAGGNGRNFFVSSNDAGAMRTAPRQSASPLTQSKLGVHWIPVHGQNEALRLIREVRPRVVLIVDPDVQHLLDAYSASPHSLFVLRDYEMSDGNGKAHAAMAVNPIGKAEQDAWAWDQRLRQWKTQAAERRRTLPPTSQMVFTGVNEPQVWTNLYETVEYTVAFLDRLAALGLRGAALNLSVGWPANVGDDTPVDWTPYTPVRDAILRGDHFLSLHEYWSHRGPDERFAENGVEKSWWRWRAGRYLQCPWDVPILITECGVDEGVVSKEYAGQGWAVRLNPDEYMGQLAWYDERISADSRIAGAVIYTTDAHGEWRSYYTDPIHDRWIAHARAFVAPQPEPSQPAPPAPVPSEQSPVVLQRGRATDAQRSWLIVALSRVMGVEPAMAEALVQVESAGRAFGDDERMIVRFEAHIFRNYLDADGAFDLYFRHDSSEPWKGQMCRLGGSGDEWIPMHTSQAIEWECLRLAESLNPEGAYRSTAFGAAQVMGFNYAKVGYISAQAMFADYAASELNQLVGLFAFALNTPGLVDALRQRDYDRIAALYNGSGNVGVYSPLLRSAYERIVAARRDSGRTVYLPLVSGGSMRVV